MSIQEKYIPIEIQMKNGDLVKLLYSGRYMATSVDVFLKGLFQHNVVTISTSTDLPKIEYIHYNNIMEVNDKGNLAGRLETNIMDLNLIAFNATDIDKVILKKDEVKK